MLAVAGDHSFGTAVLGVDAAREAKTSSLARLVKRGDYLADDDPLGVLVGEKLAMNLFPELFAAAKTDDAKAAAFARVLGQELAILGQAIDGSTAAAKVRVRGILRTGQPEFDRSTLVMNLAPLQERLVMEGRVHHIAVLLDSYRSLPAVKAQLTAALRDRQPPVVVLDWEQVAPGVAQGIAVDNASGKLFVFLLLLVVGFGILNTLLMSAFERFREFGVLMAIGVRPRTCAGTLVTESQMLMLVGFVVGAAIGGALAAYLGVHGLHIAGAEEFYEQYGMDATIYPVLTVGVFVKTFLQVWLVTSLVALYPAWKITRFRPVQALRHV
jgi:ABC-type lipoprotein release transport system permease subunit